MNAKDRVRQALEKNPDLSVAKLAQKLKISRVTVYAAKRALAQDTVPDAPTPAPTLPSVDTRQVGGDHYTRLAIQPWEIIERNGMGFFDGSALAYIMRFREKGGVQDLEKARHYLDKLIEIENGNHARE